MPGNLFWEMPGIAGNDRDVQAKGGFEKDDIVWIRKIVSISTIARLCMHQSMILAIIVFLGSCAKAGFRRAVPIRNVE